MVKFDILATLKECIDQFNKRALTSQAPFFLGCETRHNINSDFAFDCVQVAIRIRPRYVLSIFTNRVIPLQEPESLRCFGAELYTEQAWQLRFVPPSQALVTHEVGANRRNHHHFISGVHHDSDQPITVTSVCETVAACIDQGVQFHTIGSSLLDCPICLIRIGQRVRVDTSGGGDVSSTGTITGIDPSAGTVTVRLDAPFSGQNEVTVPAVAERVIPLD